MVGWCEKWGHLMTHDPDAASDALVEGMWIYHMIYPASAMATRGDLSFVSSEMTPDPKHEQKRIGRIATQSGDVTFSPTPQSLWCLALPGVLIQCTKNLGCANKASPRLDFKGWSVVQFDISIVWLYIIIYTVYIYIYIHMYVTVCMCMQSLYWRTREVLNPKLWGILRHIRIHLHVMEAGTEVPICAKTLRIIIKVII